jgi:outer membrane receptor protein involved in Fe transport
VGKSLVAGFVAAAIAGATVPAWSQEATQDADQELEMVTVTGTRLSGFSAPTPVTMISAEDLQAKAIRNVADLMQDVPALRVNFNTGQVSAPIGSSNLDLRALGPNRTLLLLDGRRFGATDSSGGVDVNVIPATLIKRVDIVTGGASAAYGSDAVSGVVNVFLDNEFEGFKADAQYGASEYNDVRQPGVSATFGTALLDSRLHVVLSADHSRNTGALSQSARPWGRNNWSVLANPAYVAGNGQPARLMLPNSLLSNMTYGGVTAVTSIPALRGLQFLPGGQVAPFVYGTNVGATFMTGGGGQSIMGDANIMPVLQRTSGFGHVSYDINDATEVYFDALVSRSLGFADQLVNTDTGNLTIRRDNVFLPQQIRTILAANGNPATFQIGRLDSEAGIFGTNVNTKVQRYTAGIEGRMFTDWNWNAYVQTGRNNYDRFDHNNRIVANYARAVDAVLNPATGQPVCRSTLTAPNNGCVPANVFGQGSVSAAAVAYYTGTSWVLQEQQQDVYAFKVDGSPLSLWAGDVSAAFGAEYRKETIDVDSDPISRASGWRQINTQPLNGKYNVKEGFLEVGVPLLKGLPFASLLDINGAVRRTDYSTSGGVTTWKAGFNFEPIDQVRFRGTVSRDIRAPSLNELFSGQSQGIAPTIDPVTGLQRSIIILTGGNPDLLPERALTHTLGVVYQPAWAQGLRLSVDYYEIEVKDAISSLSTSAILDGCYKLNQTSLCSQITRDETGALTKVEATLVNAAKTETSGVDFEVAYGLPVANGRLSLRALTTYVGKLSTTINSVTTDRAGQVGSGGSPKWRGNVSLDYRTPTYSVGALVRVVDGGAYDSTYVEGVDINDNSVSGRRYLDLNGSYRINDHFELFGKINNALNVDPPATPQVLAGSLYAGSSHYDRIGRYYTTGVRVKF